MPDHRGMNQLLYDQLDPADREQMIEDDGTRRPCGHVSADDYPEGYWTEVEEIE